MNHSPESLFEFVDPHKPDGWAAGTHNSAAIDMIRFSQFALRTRVGTVGGGTATVHVEESDDGSTGWTDVTGMTTASLATNDATANLTCPMEGRKRYLRVVLVVATATVEVCTTGVKLAPDHSDVLTDTWIKPT